MDSSRAYDAGATARRVERRGFTLIEVMIVVAIVAILSMIAFPSYTDYIRRGQVQEAPAQLLGYRARMEQHYQDNRTYAAGGNCAVALPAAPEVEYFSYACTPSNAGQAYTATATGVGGAVAGLAYSIDQRNNRTSTCTGCAWNFSGVQNTWVQSKP